MTTADEIMAWYIHWSSCPRENCRCDLPIPRKDGTDE